MATDPNPIHAPKPSNFLRGIIERDLEAGAWTGRRFGGSPGDAAHHAGRAGRPGEDPHPLSARAERLPARRPREEHLPELRPGARLRRRVPPALRRHQPREGRAGVRRRDHRGGALARLRLGPSSTAPHEPPLLRQPTTSTSCTAPPRRWCEAGLAYVDEQSADEMRAHRGDFNTPGTRQPVPQPHAGAEPGPPARDARRPAGRRRRRAAREDRHGERPTSTCATRRCTASSAPRTTTPATAGASIRCTPTRTRSRTRWRTSPTASARSSSRTSARSTTGCSRTWPTSACSRGRCPGRYEFGRLNLSYVITSKRKLQANWSTRASSTAGTTRACPRSSACAGAATRRRASARWPTAPVPARPTSGSTTACSTAPARRPRRPGPARDGGAGPGAGSSSPTGPRCSAAPRTSSPASAPAHPQRPELGQREFGLGARGLDRARRLRRGAAQGLLPPVPRQQGAPEVRHGRRVHRLREGRRTAASPRCSRGVVPDTKSGTPGADAVKVKGTITWVGVHDALPADRAASTTACSPSRSPTPAGATSASVLNPRQQARWWQAGSSRRWPVAGREQRFQFERHGYFVADRIEHGPARPVFNRITTLKDSWAA